MLIRQDFDLLPPKGFLMQIMDAPTKEYCFLWERKNADNKLFLSWKDVRFYYQKNSFRTGLRKLNNAGLLSYEENMHGVSIELVGWDEI